MNIKSLLIGSAAALASATVVNAADAIVAAEPEPLEYVRVCDAFGAGYFYIPGTETCLKIGGYVRFQVNFQRNNDISAGTNRGGRSDWDAMSRAQINFDARTETELGALRSFIDLRGDADNDSSKGVNVYQAFIELGGFRAGKFDTWWDNGLSGETDALGNVTNNNSVRYTYDAGNFAVGLGIDELEGSGQYLGTQGVVTVGNISTFSQIDAEPDNNIGVQATLEAKFGGVNFALLGGYDTDRDDGAVRAIFGAELGSGKLGLAALWSSAPNAYYKDAEWALAAEYAFQATERLKLTPGVQWYGNIAQKVTTGGTYNSATNVWTGRTLHADNWSDQWSDNDAWKAGLTVDYKITNGLTTKWSAQYYDADNAKSEWTGFVRLDRSF